jgi:hypothetical protein
VRLGLKPVLGKLGIPDKEVGLHAFRHGLATELANTNTPVPALQAQMRRADVRTTLRIYARAQRDAMEDHSQYGHRYGSANWYGFRKSNCLETANWRKRVGVEFATQFTKPHTVNGAASATK